MALQTCYTRFVCTPMALRSEGASELSNTAVLAASMFASEEVALAAALVLCLHASTPAAVPAAKVPI
eukprot:1472455-Pyramimonas_sp.AAC.1